ncbi:glycosyltransferase family 4 protein [Sinimarinibacterium sp. NLF-5-8]|uniref:glycosyltransferase family 4 protein n=1 Tax=Sinimarinibacterium sp. NLF-5-8 TaxID=2698684 RepID=UPI00137C23FB|nr:glycosyltransferase family 4 protein [Sinimarinibacterium sp. NLF-5-8]QHS09408.1 glycosyltransferase family 4 protein [Sinimarinibacterium sp. NLF-5-8]
MKIALVSQVVVPGLLTFRKELISELSMQGHKVYCFALDFNDQTRARVRDLGGIPVDYSLSRGGLNPLRDFFDTFALYRKFKQLEIDLMLAFFVKPVIYGSFAAKFANIRTRIGMLEGLGFSFTEQPYRLPFKTQLIRWVQVRLYKLAIPSLNKIIFLNDDDPKDLIHKYSIKAQSVEVLGGIGLNLNNFPYSQVDQDKIRFIFVGRLLAEKGIREYINAAKLVKSQYPDVEFVVLGGLDESSPGGLTKEGLDTLIADGTVIFPGFVDDVSRWIAESSVFVLPSYREGFPRSTQEAMAIGRAVITTDVPGCRDTVIDGVNGFLVPKWDSVALSKAMLKFIENPTLVSSMGGESYKIAKDKFDVFKVNRRLISILGIDSSKG